MPGMHVIEVTDQTFEEEVLQRSMEVPVVLDLWAPWCGPCRALGPALEALAEEGGGAWVLAKLNVDENPAIAQALRVQSIPMVYAFVEGRAIDGFAGARPRQQIEAWLANFVPDEPPAAAAKPAKKKPTTPLELAYEALGEGRIEEAQQVFSQLLGQEDTAVPARIGLAFAALATGDLEGSQADHDLLPDPVPAPHVAEAQRLWFALAAQRITDPPEALAARVAAKPGDLEARRDLGIRLIARGDYDAGLEHLLFIVMVNRAFEDDLGRKLMIRAFDIMGHKERHTIEWQGRLGAAMY